MFVMLYVFVLIHMYRWRQKVERVSKKRRWRFCRFAAGVRLFDAAASLSRKLFASFTWSQPAIKQRSNRNIQRNTPQNPCSQLNMLYIYIYNPFSRESSVRFIPTLVPSPPPPPPLPRHTDKASATADWAALASCGKQRRFGYNNRYTWVLYMWLM